MYLREIEARPVDGMMQVAFRKLRESGHAVPEIMHLFRFKKRSTNHLVRFTEEVMRGPSPLSRGLRELIGAFISTRNQCTFCCRSHVAVAERLVEPGLVEEVLADFESSRLDEAHKALFRYLARVAENPAQIVEEDIEKLRRCGWSEEAIYDALTVASVFKFYNTWNNGSGVQPMRPSDYRHVGERLESLGYCMDFSLIGILKVMWTARREVKYADLIGLARSWWSASKSTQGYAPPTTNGLTSTQI